MDVHAATPADRGDEARDGMDVVAGCGCCCWAGYVDDVGVADAADATGDAVLPAAAVDDGRSVDVGRLLRLGTSAHVTTNSYW